MISFHIGLHKTGSTYLQKEVFPLYRGCFVGSGGKGECADALRHLAGAPDAEYRPRAIQDLAQRLEAEHGNVLLSREALGGLLWDDPVSTGQRAAERIVELFSEVRVLISVRRQDDMLGSVYAQYVRQGGTQSPDAFADESANERFFDPAYLEYDRLVDAYLRALGRAQVLVLPYEKLAVDPQGVGEAIAAFVGATLEGSCPARRRNPSLDPGSLEVLRRWNRRFRRSRFNRAPPLAIPGAAVFRHLLRAAQGGKKVGTSGPAWLDLIAEERRDRYRESNQRLATMCDLALGELGYPLPGG
jgi:hypothetical protein